MSVNVFLQTVNIRLSLNNEKYPFLIQYFDTIHNVLIECFVESFPVSLCTSYIFPPTVKHCVVYLHFGIVGVSGKYSYL